MNFSLATDRKFHRQLKAAIAALDAGAQDGFFQFYESEILPAFR